MPEMMDEGHQRWEGTMGCRKQAMANRNAPALGYTYIYIDMGTYNSQAKSYSSQSANECGPQNSQGDPLNERKGLKN